MAVMPLMYLLSQMIWSFLLIASIRAIKANPCKKQGELEINEEIKRRDTLREEDLQKDLDLFQKVNRNRIMSVVAGVGGGFIPVLNEDDKEKLIHEKAKRIESLNKDIEQGSVRSRKSQKGQVNFASSED